MSRTLFCRAGGAMLLSSSIAFSLLILIAAARWLLTRLQSACRASARKMTWWYWTRVSPSDFVDKIFQTARRWDVRVVGIEEAGQQNTQHYFERKSQSENYWPQVEALKPSSRGKGSWEKGEGGGKADRIRSYMEPVIKSGLLHTLASQTVLREQIGQFPNCILWDELDALAYGPVLWNKPETAEVIESRSDTVRKLLMRRNPVSGY
jgi:hypothetical protein